MKERTQRNACTDLAEEGRQPLRAVWSQCVGLPPRMSTGLTSSCGLHCGTYRCPRERGLVRPRVSKSCEVLQVQNFCERPGQAPQPISAWAPSLCQHGLGKSRNYSEPLCLHLQMETVTVWSHGALRSIK